MSKVFKDIEGNVIKLLKDMVADGEENIVTGKIEKYTISRTWQDSYRIYNEEYEVDEETYEAAKIEIDILNGKYIDIKVAWNTIINKLENNKVFIDRGVIGSFNLITDGEFVFVEKLDESKRIKLTYEKFRKLYHLYIKRVEGEVIIKEAKAITPDKDYYFDLINEFIYKGKYEGIFNV